jgi:hypothetical protein
VRSQLSFTSPIGNLSPREPSQLKTEREREPEKNKIFEFSIRILQTLDSHDLSVKHFVFFAGKHRIKRGVSSSVVIFVLPN